MKITYTFLICAFFANIAHAEPEAEFISLAEGLSYKKFVAAAGFTGYAFKANLAAVEVKIMPAGKMGERDWVSNVVAKLPNIVATNASFFARNGDVMGAVVNEKKVLSSHVIKKWGAFTISKNKASLKVGNEISPLSSFDVLIQGMPFLLLHSKTQNLKPQRSERTAVCAEGESILLVHTSPVFASELVSFLQDPSPRGLACTNALNLDGGESTQLYANFSNLQLDLKGSSIVPNALVIIPKKGLISR